MLLRSVMMFVALSVMLAACEQPASRAATNASVPATVYADAVDDPARTAEDRQSDPGRKPAEVMQFFGIAPGMRVLDLFSGGGYYSELLSYVVGQTGSVVAQTNSAYLGFVGDQFRARFENDRLPNVTVLVAENNELELPAGGFDAVVMILAYHDIYYANPANGWEKIDGPKLLREIHHAMKPGAVLGIVDHYAESGAARETGGTVHRIDPGIVIGELEAAGFVLEAKSDLLRNMNDDYGKSVFDPAVRGTTDRFVLRFRKPE